MFCLYNNMIRFILDLFGVIFTLKTYMLLMLCGKVENAKHYKEKLLHMVEYVATSMHTIIFGNKNGHVKKFKFTLKSSIFLAYCITFSTIYLIYLIADYYVDIDTTAIKFGRRSVYAKINNFS